MFSDNARPLIGLVLIVGVVSGLWEYGLSPQIIDAQHIGSLIDGTGENPFAGAGIPAISVAAGALLLILALLLVTLFFSTLFEILINRMLTNEDHRSTSDLLLLSYRGTPALFLTSIMVMALTTGALGFFLIPGAILTILLFFYTQEVIFGGTKYWRAIENSYTIFWRNRSELFFNVVMLALLAMLFSSVVGEMRAVPAEGILAWLRDTTALISSLAYSVALTAVTIVLYREGRARTDLKKPVSLRWAVVLSVLGYVIMIAALYWLFSNDATNYKALQEAIQRAAETAS